MATNYAVIHRDALSLSPLMIDGSSYYKVAKDGIVDQQVTYDIDETSSPFVEGSWVTNDIRGMVAGQLNVQVRTGDLTTLLTAIGALLAAVQQRTFVIDIVVGGVTWCSWSCRRKSVGMTFNDRLVFARTVIIPVQFDRYPTALTGPF